LAQNQDNVSEWSLPVCLPRTVVSVS